MVGPDLAPERGPLGDVTTLDAPADQARPVGRTRSIARGVAGKLGAVVLTLGVTMFLVYASLYLAPGDPASFLLQGRSPSPEALADIKAQYGLDQPFLTQFWNWSVKVLHGDLGRSFTYRDSVSSLIAARLPTTLMLVGLSALLIIVVGLGAGILGALRAGRAVDRLVLVMVTVLAAIPSFAAAIMLISVFSVRLGLLPAFGAGEGFGDRVVHMILPAIALSLTFIALIARVTRTAMLEELGSEHVEVARSRGLPESTVVRRHVLRNAMGPISTVTALVVAGLLVGTAIVESAFGIDGVGSLLVQSVSRLDFPVVQAIVLLVVLVFVLTNLIVDLVYPLIDPRVRGGREAR